MSEKYITDQDIIASSTRTLSANDKQLIEKACAFAKEKHAGQKRYSGLPYYTHPFEVGKLLAEIGVAANVIAGGVLHDTLEDTDTTFDDLEEIFGKEIAFLVDSVSHLGEVRYQGLDMRVTSLQKLFVAISKDLRVIVIKMADRLHNMQTLDAVPDKEKRLRIAKETQRVYAPLADRMGMGNIKMELEELSFKYIDSKIYHSLKKEIDAAIGSVSLEDLEKVILKELSSENIARVSITSRIKSVYSTHLKMVHKKCSLNQIQDLVAFRVLVTSVPDAYRALGILHAKWYFIPDAFKDYISLPKPNGYRALHTRLLVDNHVIEIQILTHDMQRHAQFGIAAHFNYKEKRRGIAGLDLRWFAKLLGRSRDGYYTSWMDRLSSVYRDTSDDSSVFFSDMESDFLQDRMFIFTPKGEVVDLPRSATVVDFAFAIHSDIGFHAEGAFVNGKYVSLRHELSNGDVVNVQTGKNMTVTGKWLSWVKTAEARSRIRSVVKKKGAVM